MRAPIFGLSVHEARIAVQSLEFAVNAARSRTNGGARPDPEAVRLRDELGDFLAEQAFVAQAAQVARLSDQEQSWPTDLITVSEASKLSDRTTANIRQRCAKRTLWGAKVGGEWRLSRADVIAHYPGAA